MAVDGALAGPLPELDAVPWRRRADRQIIARRGWLWTASTAAHVVPMVATAVILAGLNPITIPVGVILLIHAWIIPELYAARGANVTRPRPGARAGEDAERRALGLLGDLLDHEPRTLHHRTGLVLERGSLGVWLVGENGALLLRPGGRRVHCYCIKVADDGLPTGDRVAHLLLALRADESGFATVANLAFSGARWRLRRRLSEPGREALAAAACRAKAA